MIQQLNNTPEISQDSIDFDPYAQTENKTSNIEINVIEDSYSESSSSDDEENTYY